VEARTKLSDRITDPTFPAVSYGQDVASNSMAIDTPQVPDSPLYPLDADHVRPGLASQYFDFFVGLFHLTSYVMQ
jgi:hypothetical protein